MVKKYVLGADKVTKKFTWLQKQSRKHNNVGVIVGYTANYALYVHELVDMKLKGKPRGSGGGRNTKTGRFKKRTGRKGKYWDPQGKGQAKFLEQPFREMNQELYDTIFKTTKALGIAKGNGLDTGLMLAGLQLQRASQELVPVDLGNLKNSAFTRLIHDNKGKG